MAEEPNLDKLNPQIATGEGHPATLVQTAPADANPKRGLGAAIQRALGRDRIPAVTTPKEDAVPTSPAPPDKSKREAWARGLAVEGAGMYGNEWADPDSPADFDPELEYLLYEKANEMASVIGSDSASLRNKDLTEAASLVQEGFSTWHNTVENGDWKSLGDIIHQLRSLRAEVDDVTARSAAVTAPGSRDKKTLVAQKSQLEKKREGLEKTKKQMVESIKASKNRHIFGGVQETMQVYGFITQCEKTAFEQIGYAMTRDGLDHIAFTVPSTVEIEKILTENIPAEDKRFLRYLLGGRNLSSRSPQEIIGGLGVLGTGTIALLVNRGVIHWETPEAAIATGATAATALASMLAVRAAGSIKRGYEDWKLVVPAGQAEDKLSFKLTFTPRVTGALPEKPSDPIARYFSDKETTSRFLQESETMRAWVAKTLKVESWMIDLSEPNMNITQGRARDFTLNRMAHDQMQIILKTEFPKDNSQPKIFSELTPSEQNDVWSRSVDTAIRQYGRDLLKQKAEAVALRMARGKTAESREVRKNEAAARASQLRSGEVVLHPKEAARAVEEAEVEKQTAQEIQARKITAKERLGILRSEIDTAQDAVDVAGDDLKQVQTQKGKKAVSEVKDASANVTTPAEAGKGEIGAAQEARGRAADELTRLTGLNGGYDEKTTKLTGLYGHVVEAAIELQIKLGTKNTAEAELSRRRSALTNLERELVDDDAQPEIVRKKDGSEGSNLKKLKQEEREQKDGLIYILDNGDKTRRGSIAEAEENSRVAFNAHATAQAISDKLQAQFNTNEIEIKKLRGLETTEGSIAWFDAKIRAAEREISSAETTLMQKRRALVKLETERDELLGVFNLDAGKIPPDTTLDDLMKPVAQRVTELEAEITDLVARQAADRSVASREDLDRADGIEFAAEALTDAKLNDILPKLIKGESISGEYSLEDMIKMGKRELVYTALLESILGSRANTEGIEGRKEIARRLISKSMLARTIIEVWNLEGRLNEFLADNPTLRTDYARARNYNAQIADRQRRVERLGREKQVRWESEATRLRSEISGLTAQNKTFLEHLFDGKLVDLLGQDRMRAATTVRMLIDDMWERCKKYNPYDEMIGIAENVPMQEVRQTTDGKVTFTRAARDSLTGALIDRGSLEIENLGGLGNARLRLAISDRLPSGALDFEVEIGKTEQIVNKLPATLPLSFPPELHLFYDESGNRRTIAQIDTFIDGITNDASLTMAAGAMSMDVGVLKRILFETGGRKRTSAEITSFAVKRDSHAVDEESEVIRELRLLALDIQKSYAHALGLAFCENNQFVNQELLADSFSNINLFTFAGTERFFVQNEEGILTAFYRTGGRDYNIELSRIITEGKIPGTANPLTDREMNTIMVTIARNGLIAMRRRK